MNESVKHAFLSIETRQEISDQRGIATFEQQPDGVGHHVGGL
jgi:hypothetical protein